MAYISSDELQKKFDVIIYGTGLTESILSAALSRNGVSVLHVDANHFYGGEWGSLMYREFMDFCDLAASPPNTNTEPQPSETDSNLERYSLRSSISSLYENVVQEFVVEPVDTAVPDTMNSVGTDITPVESSALPAATPDDTGDNKSNGTATNEIIPQDIAEAVVQSSPESEPLQTTTGNQDSPPLQTTTGNQDSPPLQTTTANQDSPPLQTTTGNQDSPPLQTTTANQDSPPLQTTTANQDSPSLQTTTANQDVPPLDTSDASSPSESTQSDHNQDTPATHDPPAPPPVVKPAPEGPLLSWTELKPQYRMFTFDLWPKLIYASDPFVDTIVKSTVTKYLEFKAVNKIVTVLDGELTSVPASRADVFTSKTVSVLEKRLLMRFVNFVMDLESHSEEVERFRGRPFSLLLEHMRLSAKLCGLIQSSIAQVDADASTETALERSKFYLQSIGRYSNSPYLWPVYGIGELPQAFCRMSAVFGGVYMLRKEIQCLELVESDGAKMCCSIRDNENNTFSCKHVILGASFIPTISPTARYSRAILVTNRKLSPTHCPDVRSDVGFITVPSHTLGPEQPHTVKLIELSANSQSAPERAFLVHLTSPARLTAREDLLPVVSFLFHNSSDQSDLPPKPKVLYAIYYNYNSRQAPDGNKSSIADNVHLISSPDTHPSYQQLLSDAKDVFQRICPGDDFLPPPPDPEDIVYEPPSPEPSQSQEKEGGESVGTNSGDITEVLNADSDEI